MVKTKRTAKKRRRSNARIILALSIAVVVALGCAVGGTLAWLVSASEPVVNTFTYGDINISLAETDTGDGDNDEYTNKYKMMPGATIAKDPVVTVAEGSEACWLFVKLDKSTNFDTFMTYAMEEGWVQLKDANGSEVAGVFFRAVSAEDAAAAHALFGVLKDNAVSVKGEVTKQQLNELTDATYPSLTITAYAVQQVGFEPEITAGAAAPTEAQINAAAHNAWETAQSSGGGTANP